MTMEAARPTWRRVLFLLITRYSFGGPDIRRSSSPSGCTPPQLNVLFRLGIMRRPPDQPAIPVSEGREFSKPLIRLKVRVVMPGRHFRLGLAHPRGSPATPIQGFPRGVHVPSTGQSRRWPPVRRRDAAGRRRAGDGVDQAPSADSSTAAGSCTVDDAAGSNWRAPRDVGRGRRARPTHRPIESGAAGCRRWLGAGTGTRVRARHCARISEAS